MSDQENKEITVVEWISESEIDGKEAAIGGMGGFFKEGMRGNKDYFDTFIPEVKPYYEALRKEIIAKGLRITGEQHQYSEGGVPVFSDGKIGSFSYRAWGDLMAAVWSEEENKDYHYMDFYM